jgi:hypothetical protein
MMTRKMITFDDDMEEVDNRVGGIGFALRKTVTELHF